MIFILKLLLYICIHYHYSLSLSLYRNSAKLAKIDYHELSEAGLLINAIGVCLIGLAILIPYIIRNSPNKRVKSDRLRLSQLDMRI